MRKLFLILFCVFLLGLISGCRPPAEVAEVAPVDLSLTDEDIAAINAFGSSLTAALLTDPFDIDGFLELFTEDMAIMPPNMPAMEGKSTYRQWLEPLGLTTTEVSMEIRDIGGSGDIAYLYINYDETFIFQGLDKPVEDTGSALGVLKRQPDGFWLLSHWMWNSNKPPAE